MNNNTWKLIQAKNKYPGNRANHTCVCYGDGIFVWGGASYNEKYNDLYFLNLGKRIF